MIYFYFFVVENPHVSLELSYKLDYWQTICILVFTSQNIYHQLLLKESNFFLTYKNRSLQQATKKLPKLIKVLKYWKLGFNDWLNVCCFKSRSRLFHSYWKSPFPMKGCKKKIRPEIKINHLLFRHTLFKAFKLPNKGVFRY